MRTHLAILERAAPRGPAPSRNVPAPPSAGRRVAVRDILHAPRPQAKLTVGAPDDAFEKEADQVADQVMRMPEPGVQRMCAECEEEEESQGTVQRMCSDCEEELQAKEEPGRTPEAPKGFEPRFAAPRVQRFATCETGEACPRRASGEIGRARGTPMFVGSVSGPYQGLLVANFAVGSGDLKRDLQSNPVWANFWGQMVTNPNIRWEIVGFSDCSGDEPQNEQLRWQRAIAVNNALPQLARNQVDSFTAAPLADCMASNADEQGRTHNRSVFIRQVSTEYTFPDQTVTRTLPAGPFLDLQIACVTDHGGCANPAGIPALDQQCRADTGYQGHPLMVLDLVCGTPGLGIAQSLDRAYPTWRSVIPSCPCTRAAAEAAPDFSGDLNPFLSSFHPGADACFRSDPVASVPGTAHRQQCCYTRGGLLITSGGGAGTPDVWGPFSRHQRIDVQPFDEFNRSFQTYNRFWIPDPGAGCAASDPCVNSCEQEFESCGEGMSCVGQRSTCLEGCRR